jgi:predicted signal transduction protein with EAL and GGDEF domain
MGGQKYMVHNILFKFAVDYNELFGNDYSAAKAAGNELRGLISYFNCAIKNLNLPLMALVDYRGFRLIALSILPVTPETIIYGSCDAGRNIHATNDDFNEEMQRAAKTLNLKAHKVRLGHNDNLHALAAPKAQFNQTESPVVFAKYQAKIS